MLNLRKVVCMSLFLLFCSGILPVSPVEAADPRIQKQRKILILPLDGRNQTFDYVGRIARICGYMPVLPPWENIGNISPYEEAYKKQYNIWYWLNSSMDNHCRIAIISADSLIYGGLIESRTSPISTADALKNADLLKIIKKRFPNLKILVFASIPRKEAENRSRNLAVNRRLIELVKEDVIQFLTISGDDVTDIGSQIREIAELAGYIRETGVENKVYISDVDRIRIGIDESAMIVFLRYLNLEKQRSPRIYVEFRNITEARTTIDYYSATPILSLTLDLIDAIGAEITFNPHEADLVLAVNHLSKKTSDEDFLDRIEKLMENHPVTFGDVSNRTEKAQFFKKLYERGLFSRLAGYATWGMGTNTLGTSISMGCAALFCEDMESYRCFLAFLYERMLADYVYLNNIHLNLAKSYQIPAYSLTRMNDEDYSRAVSITENMMIDLLKDLGIKVDTRDEACKRGTAAGKGETVFSFLIYTDLPRYFGPVQNEGIQGRITAGPVSFPFFRTFEIRIPTGAVVDKKQ